MTFAIKLPKITLTTAQGLVGWINAHLVPSLPIPQAVLDDVQLPELYKDITKEVERRLSYDYYHSQAFIKQQTVINEDTHRAWVQTQDLELHVDSYGPGQVKLSLMMFGPDIANKDGFAVGHEEIYTFFYQAAYRKEDDLYVIGVYKDASFLVTDSEKLVGINFDPVYSFDYKAKEGDVKTYEELGRKITLELGDIVEARVEMDSYPEASKPLSEIQSFFKNTWMGMGQFHQPFRVKAFASELPTAKGSMIFVTLTVNYGKQFSTVLPAIHLN